MSLIRLLNPTDGRLIARTECQKGIHSSTESGIKHHPRCRHEEPKQHPDAAATAYKGVAHGDG